MRRLRQIPAVLAMVALCLPWARVVAVSMHLSGDDHDDAGDRHVSNEPDDSTGLEDSFHGHHHESGEPRHQHALAGFDLVAQRARVVKATAAPTSMLAMVMPPVLASARAVLGPRGSANNDHGPPGRRARRSILRI